jgi:hypothetical protein
MKRRFFFHNLPLDLVSASYPCKQPCFIFLKRNFWGGVGESKDYQNNLTCRTLTTMTALGSNTVAAGMMRLRQEERKIAVPNSRLAGNREAA